MTNEQGIEYVKAWTLEGAGENVAFYMNAIEFLIAKYAPEMLRIGNGIAAVQHLMRRAAPPVPQEAAPRVRHSDGIEGECLGCEDCNPKSAPARKLALSEIPGSLLNDGIKEVEVAANRAGLSDASGLAERKIRQRFGKHGDLARIDDILAALIREAGSGERKHPPSNELLWKITRELPEQLQPMYCSMTPVPLEEIRSLISSALQDVANDEYAQAYEFFSRAGEAGSERERDAFESCAKELREHYNSDWDSTVPGAEFDAEILRILRKHLASRLLGGESNG